MKRTVILEADYSTDPRDICLKYRLCEYQGQFVVWVYNRTDHGHYHGHYYDDFNSAYERFCLEVEGNGVELEKIKWVNITIHEHPVPKENRFDGTELLW